jgi:glycosyltransferase involved in cell wall biosynthesis
VSEETKPALSVVVPVRDEAPNLGPLLREIREALDPTGLRYEVVIVDDGSTDGTGERLADLAREHPALRPVRLPAPRGQTAAFLAGFRTATGEVLVTLDGDLQNDPGDIPRLLERLSGADAVVGVRVRRNDPWLRRVSSRVANVVRNRVTGEAIADTGCSLRAFRRECAAAVPPFDGMHRFVPTLLRIAGYRVVEVPVRHRPRVAGRTKYGVWNRVFRASYDLLVVRWMKRRYLKPEVRLDER